MQGEGKVAIGDDALTVIPKGGGARSLSLRDITAIEVSGYRIVLRMVDGSGLELSMMGHRYEDLVREVHRVRNELIMKDLLMGERLRKQGVRGELRGPFRGAEGPCEVRLYDTAVVLLPVKGQLARLRYSDIRGIEARDYVLKIELEDGEQLGLGMLGRELDPLWKGISEAMAELEANVQALVKDVCPQVTGEGLTAASRLLKEGRAARRFDLETVDPMLAAALEARLRAAGLGEEYNHLASLGEGSMMKVPTVQLVGDDCIGVLITPEEYNRERSKCAGTMYHTPYFSKMNREWFEAKLKKEMPNYEELGVTVDWFLKTMFNGYQRVLFIDDGLGNTDEYEAMSQKFAADLNLRYERRCGTLKLISDGLAKTKALALARAAHGPESSGSRPASASSSAP